MRKVIVSRDVTFMEEAWTEKGPKSRLISTKNRETEKCHGQGMEKTSTDDEKSYSDTEIQ